MAKETNVITYKKTSNIIEDARTIINSARSSAVRSVDFCRVQMYWNLGKRIFEEEQQGKARAEIWTRFNRHFRIAEYAQLPTVKMSEARDYLIQMEVKALGAAAQPTATAAIPALVSDDAEGHLAAIRQHVRHIYDHEAALYGIVRHNLPSLWDIQGRERRIALRALDSMERASGALESILVCLESSTRTALAAGRA